MSQMSRVMIVLMAATCVSGAVWAQGKSGSSHGGGAPASVPATGSAPASPPSGGATGGGAPSMPSSTTSTIPAPTTGVSTDRAGTTVSTLPALPPLPTGSGLPAAPSLTPPPPGATADCGRDGRPGAKPGEAGKCQ